MPPSFWASYVEKLAVVGLLLAALYFVAGVLRRMQFFARTGRRVALVESMALSPHAALYIVRAGPRYFLIGSTAGGLSTLAELTASEVEPREATR
jgi:flagellar biogenesis protein FliO